MIAPWGYATDACGRWGRAPAGDVVVSEYRCAVVALLALWCTSCAAPVTQLPGVSADELADEKRQQQAFQREQLILQVKNFVAQSARLENVAHRLAVANRSDCKSSITPKLGW